MASNRTLRAARDAYARRDWAAARDAFRAHTDLGTDDLAALAKASWWLGCIQECIDVTAEVHRRHLAHGETGRAALAALEIGYSEFLRGNDDDGQSWFARAMRLLEDNPSLPEHGYLLVFRADDAARSGRPEEARQLIRDLLELADEHNDATLQAQGLFAAGELAIRQGRVAEGRRCLDEAMLPVRDEQVLPEWSGNLYCRMMQLCYELGDLPRAQRWTEITEHWYPDFAPAVIFRGICRVHRVQLLQVHGDWDRAEEEAQRAAAELADLDVAVVAEADYRLGELHRLRGELDDAEAAYRRAHLNGRDPLPGLALVHLRRGHGRVAASILDAALRTASTAQERAPLLAARTEVALAAGDPDLAGRTADELDALAEQHESPGWRADARRWEGAVLLARGRHAAAVPVLREARRLWQQMTAPYDVARVRLDLAAALAALGDRDSADRELDAAATSLERLGAHHELDGVRAQRHGMRGPGELSPREVEILTVVAEGATNRQVAGRLHISERTVARHLANVHLKTGAASRTGAVAWARDHGLI